MTKIASQTNFKVILALVLVHFTGDFYVSFVTPLLPVIKEQLGLSLAELGIIAAVMRVLAFVTQPTAGYLADRYQTRIFVLGGPLLSALFVPLIGWAGSFWAVILCVGLGSIGSSMLHPPAAGMIPAYAGPRPGFSMSLFTLGGTVAFGVGPLFVTYWVSQWGMKGLPYASLIGLGLIVVLMLTVPRPQGEGMRHLGFWGAINNAFGDVWRPLALLWVLVVLRTFASQSMLTFGLVAFREEGHTLIDLGVISAAYTIAGAVSGLLAGLLADRIGHKPLFAASFLLAGPSLYLMLHTEGFWLYMAAAMAGFTILATFPLGVSLAQAIAPRGTSMVSSLMMGLAFGVGGMLTPFTGHLADLYSIRTVLGYLVWVPVLLAPLVAFLSDPSHPSKANA